MNNINKTILVLGTIMLLVVPTMAYPEIVHRYDTNGLPGIQKDEAVHAVDDYLNGEITKNEVLTVMDYYLSGDICMLCNVG